jgi:hypothetical protein
MKLRRSNSSGNTRILERFRYLYDLFHMRWRGRRRGFDNSQNLRRIGEYEALAAKQGIDLKSSQILEIGVGQRPYLGITFFGLGYNYKGIDLDQQIYPPTFSKAWQIYHANGLLRLAKTLVRYFLFDQPEYISLFKQLGISPGRMQKAGIFLQCNAALVELGSLTISSVPAASQQIPLVVVSESVFEHIPGADLSSILLNLRHYAETSGRQLLILTRPGIFTGIIGSHLTEWYHHNVYSSKPKRSEPWEHLRKNRYHADTYLNCFSRADFRALFVACGYKILAETVEHPGLGSEFLADPGLRDELSEWSDDELLSNEVMFELVPLSASDGGSK